MQAIILAGGQGTRLQPLTGDIPKSVIPVGNRVLVETQLELLRRANVKDVILALNHQPEIIKKIFGDGSGSGVHLSYSVEPQPLGTAGAYKFAEKFVKTTTIIFNGDILTDQNLLPIIDRHKNSRAAATIVLKKVEDPESYGLVEIDWHNNVVNFLEKPSRGSLVRSKYYLVNAGIYILEPKILDSIPAREKYSFEQQLFPNLLQRREKIHAFEMLDAYWLDVGTPARYLQANQDVINRKIKNFQSPRHRRFAMFNQAKVDRQSIIAAGCVIEPGATISSSVLGENVFVGARAVIRNSVIWKGTKIDTDVYISDSIIGAGCVIGKNVRLERGTILGGNQVIAPAPSF